MFRGRDVYWFDFIDMHRSVLSVYWNMIPCLKTCHFPCVVRCHMTYLPNQCQLVSELKDRFSIVHNNHCFSEPDFSEPEIAQIIKQNRQFIYLLIYLFTVYAQRPCFLMDRSLEQNILKNDYMLWDLFVNQLWRVLQSLVIKYAICKIIENYIFHNSQNSSIRFGYVGLYNIQPFSVPTLTTLQTKPRSPSLWHVSSHQWFGPTDFVIWIWTFSACP